MNMKTASQQALNNVFDERRRFAVLGLTGQTGSGCTTAARLLADTFESMSAARPLDGNFSNDEERKYRILYEYLSKNWDSFYHVQLRDLISTFILEDGFERFLDFSSRTLNVPSSKLKENLQEYKKEFEALENERKSIKETVEVGGEEALKDKSLLEFYFSKVPKFTLSVKGFLDGFLSGAYTSIYQSAANNIRKSGHPYSTKFIPENMYRLSQRANKLIKILRRQSLDDGSRVLVCLDAIRNPFEASFFKERYAAFYLVAISAHNFERRARLRRDHALNDIQIDAIDIKESPKKISGADYFISQDIPRCIQMADIHIFNEEDKIGLKELKRQLVKYVALIMHPGLVTPSQSERCMQYAFDSKLNSGCISRQVGAVVTDSNFSVKAMGWNDVAQGLTPCSLRSANDLLDSEDESAYSNYERNNSIFRDTLERSYRGPIDRIASQGRPCSFCFKDMQNALDGEKNQVHTRALHAEENAFLQISKYGGQALEGGILFTTASPCELCSKKAYQIGIRKIYYVDPYPGIAKDQILRSGNKQPDLVLFTGAVGRAYQQLFNPIMPYKEEVKIFGDIEIPNVKSEMREKIKRLEYENQKLQRRLKDYELD